MSRYFAKVIALVAISLSLATTTLAEPASAEVLKYKWEDTVRSMGYCGARTGEFARWIQAEMWLHHRYPTMSSGYVDGVVGPQTDAAIKSYQSVNSMPADGCVGWYTKRNLRTYPRLQWLGGDTYRAQGSWSEYVTYRLGVCWQYQWFDGWHLPGDSGCENTGAYSGSPHDGTVGRP